MCCCIKRVIASVCGSKLNPRTSSGLDGLKPFVCPKAVGGDVLFLADRSITPYMRTRDSIHRKNSPFFGPDRFTYEPENNRYICPAGQPLNYGGRSHRNHAWTYIGTRKRCGACIFEGATTRANSRVAPLRDFYVALLAKGMKPEMARLTLPERSRPLL